MRDGQWGATNMRRNGAIYLTSGDQSADTERMSQKLTLRVSGAVIARRCCELALGRGDLGARAGCSRATIWLAATGRPIGVATVRKIARALGVRLQDLIVAGDEAAVGGQIDAADAVGLPISEGAR